MRYEGQVNIWNREQFGFMKNYKNWFNFQVVGFEPPGMKGEGGAQLKVSIISITLVGFTFMFSMGIK